MNDLAKNGGDRFPHEVTIMFFNGRYYLIRGEEHLKKVLAGNEGYPTPVACVTVTSYESATAAMEAGGQISDLWMINPRIMERLKGDGQLVESVLEG